MTIQIAEPIGKSTKSIYIYVICIKNYNPKLMTVYIFIYILTLFIV